MPSNANAAKLLQANFAALAAVDAFWAIALSQGTHEKPQKDKGGRQLVNHEHYVSKLVKD